MLEKPDVQDESIIQCLREAFGLRVAQLTFLPLGADLNTAVYRAVAEDGAPYFCKLRSGVFDELAVTLPKYLSDQGIGQIICPLTSKAGQLWADLARFKVILYPFIAGRNGREVSLSDRQWADFGAALKHIHTVCVPSALQGRLRRETYASPWRDLVRESLARVRDETFDDPVAARVAALLKAKHDEVSGLVARAEELARALEARSPQCVLCHSDCHASNILIDASGALYIVDWDDPILAPKERDLMFIGGGQGFLGHTAAEEATLFYRGYGSTQIDVQALAYYRYERIVVDIAVYCQQLLWSSEGGRDREQSFHYLESNFQPHGTIAEARAADRATEMARARVIVNDRMQTDYVYWLTEPTGENMHPDFCPELTPREMLTLGVFGGRYMTDCAAEYPADWFDDARLCPQRHNPALNLFGVNASQPLSEWRKKGWIYHQDPRGWFQWYCRYYMGRRCPDDERQIRRWRAVRRHIAQIRKHCPPGDLGCRQRQRQALLHWAYDSRRI